MPALQFIILTLFNTYVLNLSWLKRQIFLFIMICLIPSTILFSYIGTLSIFYFLVMFIIFVYKLTSKKIAIFHIFMSLIFLIISDNIVSLLLIRYLNEEMNVTVTSVYYPILLICLAATWAFLYKKLIHKVLNRFTLSSGLTYLLAFLSIGTVVFIYMNIIKIDQGNFYENVKSNMVLFLVFLLLLIVSFFILLYLAFQRYKLNRREEEMKSFETYVATIEEINRDMRKFKHDHVNMLTSLKTFIDDKNYEGLHTYYYHHILKMDAQERLNEQALMMLNNLKIDSLKGLLTTKILQAQTRQVAFYVEVVEEITDIPLNPIQLNRMVGILLDNAIEAAYESEKKEVRVALIQINASVLLVVNNTYNIAQDLKVHELFKEGFSTKGKDRGLGLAILLQMKEQWPNVNLRTKMHSPYFIQELEFRGEEKP